MVSCQKGPIRHAYAWQIGPFWQDTLELGWTLTFSVKSRNIDIQDSVHWHNNVIVGVAPCTDVTSRSVCRQASRRLMVASFSRDSAQGTIGTADGRACYLTTAEYPDIHRYTQFMTQDSTSIRLTDILIKCIIHWRVIVTHRTRDL